MVFLDMCTKVKEQGDTVNDRRNSCTKLFYFKNILIYMYKNTNVRFIVAFYDLEESSYCAVLGT